MLIKRSSPALPIWDMNEVQSADYFSNGSTDFWGYGIPIGVLRIEDVFSPSLLGTELDALVGEPGNGTWKLKVSSPSTSAFLINWSLNFFGPPPP